MKRRIASIVAALAVTVTFGEGAAQAATPTIAECLAANDASLSLAKDHKLRAERAQLLVCAASSCPVDIRKDCVSHVEEVSGQIPTIIFGAKDASGADVSAVKVTMDGEALTERLDGTALTIDPGEHSFTFETAGQPPVQSHFVIQEGQKNRREAITIGVTPLSVSSLQVVPLSEPAATTSSSLGAQRTAAIVAAAVGVVGIGVGVAFGVVSMSKHSDASAACPTGQCATQNGVNLWSDARSAGTISTAAFIAGGVVLAGGAVLWFTAKKPTMEGAPSAQVGMGLGSIALKGSW